MLFLFQHDELKSVIGSEQEFIFLRLCVLRENLEKELSMPNLPFKQDIEVSALIIYVHRITYYSLL